MALSSINIHYTKIFFIHMKQYYRRATVLEYNIAHTPSRYIGTIEIVLLYCMIKYTCMMRFTKFNPTPRQSIGYKSLMQSTEDGKINISVQKSLFLIP